MNISDETKSNVRLCYLSFCIYLPQFGGALGVMVIVVGNGHGNTSSNPGGD